ncbi:CoxG family protein [Arsenicicoccus dermatophilus]|uniref:CoxG family protein n=1 Tax=Arsenicicoccus dermatophilus TaxID=1076331 RepID=UPI0039173A9A
MRLHHRAELPAQVDHLWQRLLDVETVAACFPGARATWAPDRRSFTGTVTVGLGPVAVGYAGEGRYLLVDDERHEVTLTARGRPARRRGDVTMTVRAVLRPRGADRTDLALTTELDLAGAGLSLAQPAAERIAAPLVHRFLRRLAS